MLLDARRGATWNSSRQPSGDSRRFAAFGHRSDADAHGRRLLKRWLGYPLLDVDQLTERQEAVDQFHGNNIARGRIMGLLNQIGDLERLVNRREGGQASPKELVALRRSLEVVPSEDGPG